MKKVGYRLPDDLAKKLEDTANQQGKSKNELANEYLAHGLECTKTEKVQALKLIPLQFSGKCKKCGRQVEEGEHAWWGPGYGIICIDCEVQKYGDKSTVRKIIKEKGLDYAIQSMEKELDGLIELYRNYNAFDIIERLHQAITKHQKKFPELGAAIHNYMTRGFVKTEEEKSITEKTLKIIEEQSGTNKEVSDVLLEIRDFLIHPLKRKKKLQIEAEAESAPPT